MSRMDALEEKIERGNAIVLLKTTISQRESMMTRGAIQLLQYRPSSGPGIKQR